MIYPLSTPLLEFLILSVVSRDDSYGYEISQQLKPFPIPKTPLFIPS